MSNLRKQCALVFAVLVCVAAMPFRATMAPEASPHAGVFASKMLEVGKSRWEREGRTSAVEFASDVAAAIAAVIPQNPVGGGGAQPGPGQEPVPIETMGGSTSCPVEHTQCPVEVTSCPTVSTSCPVHTTVCKATECPANPTHCPVVTTTCQTTACPANATFCPQVSTVCPAIPTACPAGVTQCPVVMTVCPAQATVCPATETQCNVVATECPVDETTCPFTVTTCDTSTTICDHWDCASPICIITYDAGPPVGFEAPVTVAGVGASGEGAVEALLVIGAPAPIRTVL